MHFEASETNQPPCTAAAPDFLRVEEAAAVLRIGRTSAYQQAREFLATNGSSGLPVIRVGKQLRVPRGRLEAILGGPITWPIPAANDHPPATPDSVLAPNPSGSRPRDAAATQAVLPLLG